ncbi:MAG TPA: undecaprenyl-phosphate glucose phosphotransferase [Bacteroidota bacterium]|nr:undecaprenyl-phosphate glucose phosphotransferase [Bacteroidota bacterium]
MLSRGRNDFLIPTFGVFLDSLAIECAFLLSYWLRFKTNFLSFLPLSGDVPALDAYLYGSFVVIPVWLLMFNSRKMYGARRNVSLIDEFLNIVRLVTVGMLVVMSAAFFYRAFSYSRVVFGLLWGSSIILVFAGRVVLHNLEKTLYQSGRELRNAVIIGNNETAKRIYETLFEHPLLGYRLMGYFADTPAVNGALLARAEYLGGLESVPQKLADNEIELVLIALKYDEHPKIFALVQKCEGVNVEFLMVPDILELMASSMSIQDIEGIPFITIKGIPMTTWGRILKRSFDLGVSFALLVVTSPIWIIVSILVKLTSKGPVLFMQERVGLDGSKFTMLKFRSMREGAEEHDRQAGLGIPGDPRQTSIGKFLRLTSLDELPQLINVLRGEMSLVGPRPERTYYVDKFKDMIPKYLDRHRVKTGMTGWAQVHGYRGNSSLEERIKYDIYYIENWSLSFDVKILVKTIGAIFH